MTDLVRLSFSIEKPLFDRLENLVKRSGYTNRSEFVRDLIRGRLVEDLWLSDGEAVGTITLVYDHHSRELSRKLTGIQHHSRVNVLATTHIHLDRRHCAEMTMVRGRASAIRELCDSLGRQKGVLHAALSGTSTGDRLV